MKTFTNEMAKQIVLVLLYCGLITEEEMVKTMNLLLKGKFHAKNIKQKFNLRAHLH